VTHEFGHVECGGAGALLGEKQITIYDHAILNVANHLKHEAMVAFLVGQGMPADKADRKARRLGQMIANDAHRWYDYLEDLGIGYEAHDPHPQNFT
jgi:hypothetical protein